ncbi:hypothetical protein ZWY2020_058824 [Hordeum vulgare]|nr:hypothetical protein ZWY2020_058824 [Hordeum vulgare]
MSTAIRKRPAAGQEPRAHGGKKPRHTFGSISDYKKQVLGEGTYGEVFKARHRRTRKNGAVMWVRGNEAGGHGPPDMRAIIREAGCQAACRVTSRLSRSSMWPRTPRQGILTRVMMEQLLDAAKTIHGAGVIHRDIKPENVMVGIFGGLKVGDFGSAMLAKPAGVPYEECCVGTRIYTSPEQLEGHGHYGQAVDMWALGCIMAEMLGGDTLFVAETEEELLAEMNKLQDQISSTGKLVRVLRGALGSRTTGGVDGRRRHVPRNQQVPVPGVAGGGAQRRPPARRRRFFSPGQSKRVGAPATWNSRFWGRTGCNFAGTGCLTGDCEGRLACNRSIGALRHPRRGEPARGPEQGKLLRRERGGRVQPAGGRVDQAGEPQRRLLHRQVRQGHERGVPAGLQVTSGKKATVVACRARAWRSGWTPSAAGAYGTAETCRGSVYSRIFRDACPAYYSYAYDVAAALALLRAGYVLTFCPSRWGDRVARLEQCVTSYKPMYLYPKTHLDMRR